MTDDTSSAGEFCTDKYGPVIVSYSRSEELTENINRLKRLFNVAVDAGNLEVAFNASIEINRLTSDVPDKKPKLCPADSRAHQACVKDMEGAK